MLGVGVSRKLKPDAIPDRQIVETMNVDSKKRKGEADTGCRLLRPLKLFQYCQITKPRKADIISRHRRRMGLSFN